MCQLFLLVSPEREKIEYQAVDTRGDTRFSSNTDIPSFENTQDHQWRAGEKRFPMKAQHMNLLDVFFLLCFCLLKSFVYIFPLFLEIEYNIHLILQCVSELFSVNVQNF